MEFGRAASRPYAHLWCAGRLRRAIRSITFAHFVSLMRFGGSATIPLAQRIKL
jgi:hypothetical protein